MKLGDIDAEIVLVVAVLIAIVAILVNGLQQEYHSRESCRNKGGVCIARESVCVKMEILKD